MKKGSREKVSKQTIYVVSTNNSRCITDPEATWGSLICASVAISRCKLTYSKYRMLELTHLHSCHPTSALTPILFQPHIKTIQYQ